MAGKANLPLQRESVARAALDLLDTVGLDGLTVRRLATYLDIQNPSLYSHFSSKQELHNYMATLMIADGFVDLRPLAPGQHWGDWLAEFARLLRRTMLSHRDGARLLAEADVSFNDFYVGIEMALEALQHGGFDTRDAGIGVRAIIHYVLGTTFEAQADPSALHGAMGVSEANSPVVTISVDEARFPRVAELFQDHDLLSRSTAGARFEEGLSLILDGMWLKLAKMRPSAAE